MATVDKKYLDLAGLQSLVTKRALVVHPTLTQTDAAAYKIGWDAYGHVRPGTAIQPSDIGAVPTSRTVAGHALTGDVTLSVSDITGAVPNTRTIAGIDLQDNITNAELAQALGISGAMNFIGVSTTDPSSSSGATVSGHTSWKKGDVVVYKRSGETGYEEYIATADDNAHWEKLGDADDYALKTITVSGDGTYVTGSGTLASNVTLSHKTYTAADAAPVAVGRDSGGHVVLGGAISISGDGAHSHTVSLSANKVVTSVSSTSANYTWSIDKGTGNANVKTVVTDYSGTTNKLNTTSIKGVSGSTTASKATASTAVSVAKTGTAKTVATLIDGTAIVGNAAVDTAVSGLVNGFDKTAYHAEYVTNSETLKLSLVSPSTTSVKPAIAASTTLGAYIGTTSVTPAEANGSITPYTFTDVVVPVAAAATTVATGSVSGSGTGDSVLTGLGTKSTTTVLSDATAITVGTTATGGTTLITSVTPTKAAVTDAGTAASATHTHSITTTAA